MAYTPAICHADNSHVFSSGLRPEGDHFHSLGPLCPFCGNSSRIVNARYTELTGAIVGLLFDSADYELLTAYREILTESESKNFRAPELRTDLENLDSNWKNLWNHIDNNDSCAALTGFNLIVATVGVTLSAYIHKFLPRGLIKKWISSKRLISPSSIWR